MKNLMLRAVFFGALILPMAGNVVSAEIEYITGDNIPALGPYSPATVLGDLVFTSGQIAFSTKQGKIVEGDIMAQTRQALDNLKAVLEASGSSLDHTLRITVYLKNPEDFSAMNKVYAQYFPDNKPARTTVPGVEWGKGLLVEVDAIAVRKK